MRMQEADDELMRRLGRLGVAEPDAVRLERVRSRCHAALLRRKQQAQRRRRRAQYAAQVLEPILVGGLSAGYLLMIVLVLLNVRF
jgi:type VI protein secretion system component VasF